MKGYRRGWFPALLLMLVGGVATLGAQTPADSMPPAASEAMRELVGQWSSRWDYLDTTGAVVGSAEGVEDVSWSIPGRLLEMRTAIPARGQESRAWVFYSIPQRAMFLTSVDAQGDLWILRGDSAFHQITSIPHPAGNGRMMIVRFTHTRESPDVLRALMEYSFDQGATWRAGFRQELRRTGRRE